jgi:hypothetical protein
LQEGFKGMLVWDALRLDARMLVQQSQLFPEHLSVVACMEPACMLAPGSLHKGTRAVNSHVHVVWLQEPLLLPLIIPQQQPLRAATQHAAPQQQQGC